MTKGNMQLDELQYLCFWSLNKHQKKWERVAVQLINLTVLFGADKINSLDLSRTLMIDIMLTKMIL